VSAVTAVVVLAAIDLLLEALRREYRWFLMGLTKFCFKRYFFCCHNIGNEKNLEYLRRNVLEIKTKVLSSSFSR